MASCQSCNCSFVRGNPSMMTPLTFWCAVVVRKYLESKYITKTSGRFSPQVTSSLSLRTRGSSWNMAAAFKIC